MKEKISADFLTAYKAGKTHLKTTLGSIRAAIGNWETAKQNAGKTITDADVINILGAEAKKRKDAIALYTQEGSEKGLANALNETYELLIIQDYLPKQMTDDQIKDVVIKFLGDDILPVGDMKIARAMFGTVMKEFKTHYNGEYNAQTLKVIAEGILELN